MIDGDTELGRPAPDSWGGLDAQGRSGSPDADTLPERGHVSADDRAHIERLHAAVREATEDCDRVFASPTVRRRLQEALDAERVALEELGFESYSEFAYAMNSDTALPAPRGSTRAFGPTATEPTAPDVDVEARNETIAAVREEIERLQLERDELASEAEAKRTAIETLRREHESLARDAETERVAIEALRAEQAALLDAAEVHRREVEELTSERDQQSAATDEARGELARIQAELGAIADELADREAERDRLRVAIDSSVAAVAAHESDLAGDAARAAKLRAELAAATAELDDTRHELDEAKAALEAVHDSIRFAREEADAARLGAEDARREAIALPDPADVVPFRLDSFVGPEGDTDLTPLFAPLYRATEYVLTGLEATREDAEGEIAGIAQRRDATNSELEAVSGALANARAELHATHDSLDSANRDLDIARAELARILDEGEAERRRAADAAAAALAAVQDEVTTIREQAARRARETEARLAALGAEAARLASELGS
jgi:predicted  nucleic acid-binding Zn-ribbon protein